MPDDLEQPVSAHPLISSGRVWLRPLEERDLAALMLAINDREVGGRAGFQIPFGPQMAKEWLADKLHKMDEDRGMYFAVCELGSSTFIVTVWLNHLSLGDRNAELAIAMDAGHVGAGWGTEAQRALLALAFGTIGLHRVYLHVDAGNERAIRSYRKVGFVEEGRLRAAWLHDGVWTDSFLMAILADEWRASTATTATTAPAPATDEARD